MEDRSRNPGHQFTDRFGSFEDKRENALRDFERLFELAQQTDPLQLNTSVDKDFKAYEALKIIGNLTHSLAGWAVYHQIGLANKGLDWVSRQPSGTNENEEYLKKKQVVDSHEFEAFGRTFEDYGDAPSPLDNRFYRQLLRNLLYPNPLRLPNEIKRSYLDSLDASKNNEATGFLDIPKAGHQENATEAIRLRLKAMEFVYFLKASGLNMLQARNCVGEAYGVGAERVRKWESELNASRSLDLERAKSFARNGWSSFAHYKKENNQEEADFFEAQYNDQELARYGERFQALKRSGKKKTKKAGEL